VLLKLSTLSEIDPVVYRNTLQIASHIPASAWTSASTTSPEQAGIFTTLSEAHRVTQMIRKQLRQIGILTGVPIEPDVQGRILDRSVSLNGVIGGGIPGAGGYDALWLLIIDVGDEQVLKSVEALWATSESLQITPLTAVESRRGGTAVERLSSVPVLESVLNSLTRDND